MDNRKYANEGMTKSDRMIHTPSSFARKNLNFVQEIGVLESLKAHTSSRENMDSYLFFLVEEGEGCVNTGGKDYEVHKGDCVLLDCRKHYEHTSSDENPWKIRWVHFTGAMVGKCFTIFEEGNESKPVFTPKSLDDYVELLEELKAHLSEKNIMDEVESSHILMGLIIKCLEVVTANKELSLDNQYGQLDDDEYASLRESVNEHCDDDSIQRILSIQYGLEPEKLNEIFEKKYGISMDKYILNRKFNKAKELLRFTIKPVEEIMEESGIRDQETFKQLFIESEEMTPEEYRKKWGQWIKS